jgi:hypothetical protein
MNLNLYQCNLYSINVTREQFASLFNFRARNAFFIIVIPATLILVPDRFLSEHAVRNFARIPMFRIKILIPTSNRLSCEALP